MPLGATRTRERKAPVRRLIRPLRTILILCIAVGVGQVAWSHVRAELRSRALWRQVQGGPGAVVDFTQLGPSGWDRVFIFHPYTSESVILEALGHPWPDADRTSIGWNDGVNLVVFTRAGRVCGWFDHPRNWGDLLFVASRSGYPREEALFTVVSDQEGRLVLAPQ